MALPRRRAENGGPGPGLRPGIVLSGLLHLGFAALAILASLRREKPPEPLPPPAYAMEFEGGAPDRPAEPEINPPPSEATTAAPELPAEPPVEPPSPQVAWAPPEEPAPPPPPAEAEGARTAESEPPPPEDEQAPLPPTPPQPRREAALISPPAPTRPPPSEPLPGILMPGARSFQAAPQLSPGPRRGLDLSPGQFARPGRDSPEPQFSVRGAKVGPDWHSALRRWWIDHRRYPANAALVGQEGVATVEMDLAPDGRVRSVRLIRPSGSVWLDAGAVSQFRGAVLPALPPGVDPSGATLTFTINYILIR